MINNMSWSIKVINEKFDEVSNVSIKVNLHEFNVNIATIYKVVNCIISNSKRVVYSHYKSTSGLAGSGRKLRKQKRTGRARVGDVGSISTRGGAVKFGFSGDKSKDYVHKFKRYKHVNRKEAAKVLFYIVINRYKAKRLTVIENLSNFTSTKSASKFMQNFTGTNLLVYHNKDRILYFGNLKNIELCHIDSFNAFRAAKRENIIFDKDAFEKFLNNIYRKLNIQSVNDNNNDSANKKCIHI